MMSINVSFLLSTDRVRAENLSIDVIKLVYQVAGEDRYTGIRIKLCSMLDTFWLYYVLFV